MCSCRLKKELEEKCSEVAKEKFSEVAEPLVKVDPHQRLCDIAVRGPPGTKVESMKVVIVVYCYASFTKLCCCFV